MAARDIASQLEWIPFTIWPGNPRMTDIFLNAAAMLSWRPYGRLGTFTDASGVKDLIVTPDGTWSIADAAPPGIPSFLLSEETFNVLHGGELHRHGSIVYRGQHYELHARIEGKAKGEARLYAEAVAV
jgi:hypothetical protein